MDFRVQHILNLVRVVLHTLKRYFYSRKLTWIIINHIFVRPQVKYVSRFVCAVYAKIIIVLVLQNVLCINFSYAIRADAYFGAQW